MYSEFKTELDSYLATNWGETPIYDYANNPGSPPNYDEWMGYKPVLMSDEVYATADGAHCVLALYGLEFSVFIGSATGQNRAIYLSEQLKKLFIGKQMNSMMTFQEVDTEFGVKNESESSGKWYRTLVFVNAQERYFL